MPRKVKKVKIAKDQRPKKTKKFWIILSCSIATGIAAIVTAILLIYFLAVKKDEYDYFDEIDSSYSLSWNRASKKINEIDNMLIFYWSEDVLDPENSTSDATLETNIERLYKTVIAYNEQANKDEELDFCLVNIATTKGKPALNDSKSGVTENSCALAYYYNGKYSKYPFGIEEPKSMTTEEKEQYDSKYVSILDSDLTNVLEAISFVNTLAK